MKRFFSLFLLCSLGGCTAGYGAGAGSELIPRRPAGATYGSWEHLCVAVTLRTINDVLNEAGEEGWELVSGPDPFLCFKRPLERFEEEE